MAACSSAEDAPPIETAWRERPHHVLKTRDASDASPIHTSNESGDGGGLGPPSRRGAPSESTGVRESETTSALGGGSSETDALETGRVACEGGSPDGLAHRQKVEARTPRTAAKTSGALESSVAGSARSAGGSPADE